MRVAPPEASDLDEIRFLRATLAPSVLDATFDYERIIADPSSERRRESLLRVAQRAIIAGESTRALNYLRTLARDYPDDASLATALYWKAAVLFDSHDGSAACDANREARSHAQISSPGMLATIDAQGSASCPRTAPIVIAQMDSSPRRPIAVAGKPIPNAGTPVTLYAVQVAAFPTRSDAEEMAARLTRRGLDAHADGTQWPFRVRVGHYGSYAEAAAELRKLKAQKMAGFVTQLEQ
ncbi:MAG: SPOR domain-containing protein [Gemmatimonadota bacterium]|nr:SPOR domain-containing protein [Gemmatimonadota bacterium]